MSLTVSRTSIFEPAPPCGLWQSEHATLPSLIGWREGRLTWARISLWQVSQVFLSGFPFASWHAMHSFMKASGAGRGNARSSGGPWHETHSTPYFACSLWGAIRSAMYAGLENRNVPSGCLTVSK